MAVDTRLAVRLRTHSRLADRLAALDDKAFAAWDRDTDTWHGHIFGTRSRVIDLDGTKVFIKQIPLTELERAHPGSTANLFDLPPRYHYGVGSAGFGAWRELSVQLRAHDWAATGQCETFPLVHHWRILPRTAPTLSARQLDWLEQAPAYWADDGPVAHRLAAIAQATFCLTLCLEFMPQTLEAWLTDQQAASQASITASLGRFHGALETTTAFLNAHGVLHFDLHGHNILTDGDQVFVTDFGLVLCADHDLSADERTMLETHRQYDRAYLNWAFAHWLKRFDTPELQTLRDRCSPPAETFDPFYQTLSTTSRTATYPATELSLSLTPP